MNLVEEMTAGGQNGKRAAFTLAEVLITLAIIGVVAALTLPTVLVNINERRNSEREANIAYKITQAMEHMRATGTLTEYDSTEAFVNELKKHLKITKICDKDHITDCWPSTTVTDKEGNEFDVSKAKTGKNLNLSTTTNNVGLILADGASIILNYDPSKKGFDIGDPVTTSKKFLPIGGGKSKEYTAYTSDVTRSIDFVMDVNGTGKPNREQDKTTKKQYDIRSFESASFSKGCAGEYDDSAGCLKVLTTYDPVNCDTSSSNYAGDTICGPHPSGRTDDYWAGAKKACKDIDMQLPELSELRTIYNNKSSYPSLKDSDGRFWSATELEYVPQDAAMYVRFSGGIENGYFKYNYYDVVCAGN